MKPKKYILFAGIGALCWCTIFITLGYFLGENIDFSDYYGSIAGLFSKK